MLNVKETVKITTLRFYLLLLTVVISSVSCSVTSQDSSVPVINPERFKDAIWSFKFRDKTFPPAPGGIVFVGSSSFALWNDRLDDDLAPLDVIARGFGGSTIDDVLYYADQIIFPYKPRAVVVYEGDNDIGSYKMAPKTVRDKFETLFLKLQDQSPGTRLYVVSIKPSIVRQHVWPLQKEANGLLKALCDSHELMTYIDVATPMFNNDGTLKALFVDDNLHMNKAGYTLWRGIIKSVLMEKEGGYILKTTDQ